MPTAKTPAKTSAKKRQGPVRPTRANDPHYAERAAKAVELRKAGATYDDIARALGISSRGTACEIVQNALRRSVAEPAAELIDLESLRLDRLWIEAYRIATTHDDMEMRLKAIDRCVRLSERRSKLLGLDAGDQLEERRVELAEQQAQTLAGVFAAVFADLALTAEQRAVAPRIARQHIEAITARAVEVA